MSSKHQKQPMDRAGKTLIKAFIFAGTILGVGAFGLMRTIALFAGELGWLDRLPNLGPAYWWMLGGAGAGFLAGWLLVRGRRERG